MFGQVFHRVWWSPHVDATGVAGEPERIESLVTDENLVVLGDRHQAMVGGAVHRSARGQPRDNSVPDSRGELHRVAHLLALQPKHVPREVDKGDVGEDQAPRLSGKAHSRLREVVLIPSTFEPSASVEHPGEWTRPEVSRLNCDRIDSAAAESLPEVGPRKDGRVFVRDRLAVQTHPLQGVDYLAQVLEPRQMADLTVSARLEPGCDGR